MIVASHKWPGIPFYSVPHDRYSVYGYAHGCPGLNKFDKSSRQDTHNQPTPFYEKDWKCIYVPCHYRFQEYCQGGY